MKLEARNSLKNNKKGETHQHSSPSAMISAVVRRKTRRIRKERQKGFVWFEMRAKQNGIKRKRREERPRRRATASARRHRRFAGGK